MRTKANTATGFRVDWHFVAFPVDSEHAGGAWSVPVIVRDNPGALAGKFLRHFSICPSVYVQVSGGVCIPLWQGSLTFGIWDPAERIFLPT
jgi:hypothetical protein